MDQLNNFESELNKIRLELYEETKNMTASEHTTWSNEQGKKLAQQYGFKIGTPPAKRTVSTAI